MVVAHREEQIITEGRCQEVTCGGGTQGGAEPHRGQVVGGHMRWWHTGMSRPPQRTGVRRSHVVVALREKHNPTGGRW